MDYSKAEATVTNIQEAIELSDKLIGELTEAILQTSVGSITTLQEKITQLKSTLDAAKTTIEGLIPTMKSIESDVKGS